MKKNYRGGLLVACLICVPTLAFAQLTNELTKEQCEQMCSPQQCQEKIWGACNTPTGSCPDYLMIDQCALCRDIAPESFNKCLDIYKNGGPTPSTTQTQLSKEAEQIKVP